MSELPEEEDRQFERVLSRLDALMRHSHVSVPADTASRSADDTVEYPVDVPVLTEVYQGAERSLLAVSAGGAPPLLTEFAGMPGAAAGTEPEPLAPSREAEIDMVVAELMPVLHEMVVNVVREELENARRELTARVIQEAERLLRQRLQCGAKPK